MTDLTEQWKKGKLKKAYYYIKFPDTETPELYDLFGLEGFRYVKDNDKIKVLAEVPSYEDWRQLNDTCHELEKETACLTVDLVNVKNLLKECKQMLMSSNYENMVQYHEVLELRDKINEVLK